MPVPETTISSDILEPGAATSVERAVAENGAQSARQVVHIRPSRGWAALRLADLWEYRELVYFLTWRDVKVRYKQTVLGIAWAVLQPLLMMLVFNLFLGRIEHVPSDGVAYPLFVFSALVPWTFFANGLTQASNSLVGNANLITKVYFPRLVVPVATVLSGVIDFLLTCAVLLAMMAYFRVAPSVQMVWIPVCLALVAISALGFGLWLSAMNVQFRDVRYTVPFLTQLWMFATPVVYPSSLVHQPWRTIFAINPMVGAVEGFRWSLFDHTAAPVAQLIVSFGAALTVLLTGAIYFRRMERTFADIV